MGNYQDREDYERATMLGHYEFASRLGEGSRYSKYTYGLGMKLRMHPLAAALVEWNRERLATRIALDRLSYEDTSALLATLFDDPGLINRMLPRYLSVTPAAILEVSAATFRPDNRLVLTYLPEVPTADDASVDADRDRSTDSTDEDVAA